MKINYFLKDILSLIIISMPFLLITGPFLADLGLSIVALSFIINSLKINYLNIIIIIILNFFSYFG